MNDLFPEGALGVTRAIAGGVLSAEELTRTALERIESQDAGIGAFTDITRERALSEARTVDHRRAAGEALGPLAGVPYAVKNLYSVAGLPTRAGSKINASYPAAETDALLIARMQPQAPSFSVRSTWENTLTTSRARTRITAHHAIHSIRRV